MLADAYKSNYSNWKNKRLATKSGFFIVYNDFKDRGLLRDLSGGALKCYIFLGITAKNNTGESWYTIDSISSYFQVSNRTVSNWINELEKYGLIRKLQFKPNEPAHTFLQPY